MNDNDVTAGKRRWPLVRGAGAVSALAGLAGCLFDGDGDAGPGDEDPTSTGTETACPTPNESRQSELETVKQELAAVEIELQLARLARTVERGRRSRYPGGYDASVLDRAGKVADRLRESVVHITGSGGGEIEDWQFGDHPGFGGAGWFRTPTEVVASAHVVDRLDTPTLSLPNGDRFEAEIVRSTDAQIDVAILRTEYEGRPLPVGNASDLEPGQPLVQVGHPSLVGRWIPTLGRYVCDREDIKSADLSPSEATEHALPNRLRLTEFASTVSSQGGASGSPVATLGGEVVGMLNRGWTNFTPLDPPPQPVEPFVYDQPVVSVGHPGVYQKIEDIEEWIKE